MTAGFFDTVSLALMLLSGLALETRVDGYPAAGEDSETPPYSLDVSSDSYENNRQVEVWLTSLVENEQFTRFLLSAYNQRGERVGQWVNSEYDGNVRIDNNRRTATNVNDEPKVRIGAAWRAPSHDVGPVVFKATVVSDTDSTPARQVATAPRVQSRTSFRVRGRG